MVLFDGYPIESSDLSDLNLEVLSIRSGIKFEKGLQYYPKETTTFYLVEGANHAQFGDYGVQGGDTTATISREVQQAIATNQTVSFFRQFSTDNS